jgi:hypothetical protein
MVCGYLRKKISEIRLSSSVRDHHSNSIDWTLRSSARVDPVTTDVVAPSPWTIFGCQNGIVHTQISLIFVWLECIVLTCVARRSSAF